MIYMFKPYIIKIFQNTCVKTYELDPARILTASGLAWQVALKRPR